MPAVQWFQVKERSVFWEDFDHLQEWKTDKWYSTSKRITNNYLNIWTSYNIHYKQHQKLSITKYLGVTTDSTFTQIWWQKCLTTAFLWEYILQSVIRTSRQQVKVWLEANPSLFWRQFSFFYFLMWQPEKAWTRQLEYAATAWDPPTETNIAKL